MQKTMNIDGQKVTVRVRRRHSRGNPIGWIAKIDKATYFFNVLDPQEAIDKAVAKYRAATGAQAILTIDEANAIATGRAVVSADPVDASLWLVQGDGWTESHEPMNRADWERFLAEQNALGSSVNDHEGSGTREGNQATAKCIAKHPMYSPSDLAYFRRKGYSDEEILAFWDRDHALGHKPCHHQSPPDLVGMLSVHPEDHDANAAVNAALERIAHEHLGIQTLATRKSDALDFHEVSVWQLKAALEAAFVLGHRAARHAGIK